MHSLVPLTKMAAFLSDSEIWLLTHLRNIGLYCWKQAAERFENHVTSPSNAILQLFRREDVDACQSRNPSKVIPKAPGIYWIPLNHIQVEKLGTVVNPPNSYCPAKISRWQRKMSFMEGSQDRNCCSQGTKTNASPKFAKKHPGEPREWKLFGKHTYSRRRNEFPAVYVRKTNGAFILRCIHSQT